MPAGRGRSQLVDAFPHLDPGALRGRVAQVAAALWLHTHYVGDVTAGAVAAVNPKDRHVATTAFAHGANLVVSNDRRLRREINALGGPLLVVTGGVAYGADAAFGGYKASGVGRQNGLEGFLQYTETKTIAVSVPAD